MSDMIRQLESVLETDGDLDVMMDRITRGDGVTLCDRMQKDELNIWGCKYHRDSGMYIQGSPKDGFRNVLIIG